MKVLCTQHVLHGGVMHALVGSQLQSCMELGSAVDIPVVCASKVGHQVIIVLGLYPIDGIIAG